MILFWHTILYKEKKYNITQTSLTALLRILKDEGYNKLPSDSRTLLNTPKKNKYSRVRNWALLSL